MKKKINSLEKETETGDRTGRVRTRLVDLTLDNLVDKTVFKTDDIWNFNFFSFSFLVGTEAKVERWL